MGRGDQGKNSQLNAAGALTRRGSGAPSAASSTAVKSIKTVLSDGTEEWRNEAGELHREDGPAIVRPEPENRFDGNLASIKPLAVKEYWRNGKLRTSEVRPARIYADGGSEWWIDGEDGEPQLARVEIPFNFDGSTLKERRLYKDGKLHSEDGPAITRDRCCLTEDGDWLPTEEYWQDGEPHNENGPALIWSGGTSLPGYRDPDMSKEERSWREEVDRRKEESGEEVPRHPARHKYRLVEHYIRGERVSGGEAEDEIPHPFDHLACGDKYTGFDVASRRMIRAV